MAAWRFLTTSTLCAARAALARRVLPDRERETFLAQYRRAVDGARDPAGWKHLQRFPRLWVGRAISANRPGSYEARARALAGTGKGMLLDDALRHFRPGG